MKVAIVDRSNDLIKKVQEEVQKKLKKKHWDIGAYNSGEELLSGDTTKIDAILLDQDNLESSNEKILNKIKDKDIDIAILNETTRVSTENRLVHNERINAILDKRDPNDVCEWLSYVEVKHRINKRVKHESNIYSEIISKTNGCKYEVKNGVTLLGISKLLPKEKIDTITKAIEQTNNKVVLYFTKEVSVVSSSFFGLLIVFWERIVKERKGKMAYWLKDSEDTVMQTAKMLSISELFPFFKTLPEALEYVNKSNK